MLFLLRQMFGRHRKPYLRSLIMQSQHEIPSHTPEMACINRNSTSRCWRGRGLPGSAQELFLALCSETVCSTKDPTVQLHAKHISPSCASSQTFWKKDRASLRNSKEAYHMAQTISLTSRSQFLSFLLFFLCFALPFFYLFIISKKFKIITH